MLGHSFDRFYVVTKFILPMLNDLKLSLIEYDEDCKYIRKLDDQNDENIKQNIRDLLLYYAKLRPYKTHRNKLMHFRKYFNYVWNLQCRNFRKINKNSSFIK